MNEHLSEEEITLSELGVDMSRRLSVFLDDFMEEFMPVGEEASGMVYDIHYAFTEAIEKYERLINDEYKEELRGE